MQWPIIEHRTQDYCFSPRQNCAPKYSLARTISDVHLKQWGLAAWNLSRRIPAGLDGWSSRAIRLQNCRVEHWTGTSVACRNVQWNKHIHRPPLHCTKQKQSQPACGTQHSIDMTAGGGSCSTRIRMPQPSTGVVRVASWVRCQASLGVARGDALGDSVFSGWYTRNFIPDPEHYSCGL
jgi:hypothetical protein